MDVTVRSNHITVEVEWSDSPVLVGRAASVDGEAVRVRARVRTTAVRDLEAAVRRRGHHSPAGSHSIWQICGSPLPRLPERARACAGRHNQFDPPPPHPRRTATLPRLLDMTTLNHNAVINNSATITAALSPSLVLRSCLLSSDVRPYYKPDTVVDNNVFTRNLSIYCHCR